ncbi:hypothetical protein GCM10022255_000140 [Dactylosporangium darangshiense]|uniref:Uncharacterized protein n=1 Tax=Dactylosporangium darangshiense TaxID=579108 RepID=A0ABP8CTB2_9ACTN
MGDKKSRVFVWVAASVSCAMLLAALVLGLDGRGPAASVVCDEERIAYAHEPRPVQGLADDSTLRVGDARAVGGNEDPWGTWSPRLMGDASLVSMREVTYPDHRRCGRAIGGYRYFVITMLRAGDIVVVAKQGREERTMRIRILEKGA